MPTVYEKFYITIVCPNCKGRGWKVGKHTVWLDKSVLRYCQKCWGIGKIRKKVCISYMPFKPKPPRKTYTRVKPIIPGIIDEFTHIPSRQKRYYARHPDRKKESQKKYKMKYRQTEKHKATARTYMKRYYYRKRYGEKIEKKMFGRLRPQTGH